MSMSKADFERVARVLRDLRSRVRNGKYQPEEVIDELTQDLADVFQTVNDRFDPAIWNRKTSPDRGW